MAPTQADIDYLAALSNAGHYAELEALARIQVERYPDFGYGWHSLGTALRGIGQLDESVACYRHALELKPDALETLECLADTLHKLGQNDAAQASRRKAAQIKYNAAEAHNNTGLNFHKQGELDAAVTHYRQALEFKPDFARAYNNLGLALSAQYRYADAADCFRSAIQLNPNVSGYNNLGIALRELGQIDAAIANYQLALNLQTDSFDTHINLGNAQKDLGQYAEAIASYRRALQLKPDSLLAQTNLLFTMNHTALAPELRLEEARQYGHMVARKVSECFTSWLCPPRTECLRVGFVSGDLYNHPVAYFLESLVTHIAPTRIELFAYPSSNRTDQVTARIRSQFAAWKPIAGMGDQEAANLIHGDGIHILIDLSGHTGNNRLPMFAYKPAPVQVTWLGYFATTGVAAIDYLLADEVGVPKDCRSQFTESIWYLPDTRLCFSPPAADIPVALLPALQNRFITFGCFQNLSKVNDDVLALWGKILAAVPDSKLRMQNNQLAGAKQVEQTLVRLQRVGISGNRISLHGLMPRNAYLAAHSEIDIVLDTFPYPGGTTTCEALWMGVPTLTLVGNSLLSRQGASVLTAAGLQDWIAHDENEYVTKAISFSSDPDSLASLRARLRDQVLGSPLFDAPQFAKNFERALWDMWQVWHEKQQKPNASH